MSYKNLSTNHGTTRSFMNFSNMLYGGDYNPGQWPEEVWFEDIELMKEAGVNLVSLGIFSWAKLEPKPGEFEFAWMDRLMDLLHENGISVDLATPTASPPPWMVTMHPAMLPVNAAGQTLWHGSRRHYCPHNVDYHFYAKRVAQKLAERYKDHPALVMWHVDNEYGCHVSECYCDTSAAAFRLWLKQRYGSLDKLNFAWGTAFWSQLYGDWNEIQPSRLSPAHINPTQQLDWARFSSDSWLDCFQQQKAILKQITPEIPVVTNFMSFHKGVDYFKFAQHEDIVTNDSYPDTWQPDWPQQAAIACDLMRSLGKGNPWMLMEQASSQVNWRPINVPKRPGIMRLGSLQAVARGADGILFFQWRQSKAGAEKHHSGMLPHGGTETRTWREIKSLGGELAALKPLIGSRVQSEVAILFDWNNWWALEIDSKPSTDLKMIPQVQNWYNAFYARGITVDFAHPGSDLSSYKLVVAPALYLVEDHAVNNLNNYVKAGGYLITTFFSGIVDSNDHIRLGGYPAPFREMLGLMVEEYVPFPQGLTNTIQTMAGDEILVSLWADVIRTEGAETLARFGSDYFAGGAAVTSNIFGKGRGVYVGTELPALGKDWLLETACRDVGVTPAMELPVGVEFTCRTSGSKTWQFFLNHTGLRVVIPIKQRGFDLLSGKPVNTFIELDVNGAVVIELE